MNWEKFLAVAKEVGAIILAFLLKLLGTIWSGLKWLAAFLWKYIKIIYKKVKKAFKKYVRMLIKHTKAGDYSILTYTIIALVVLILVLSLLIHGLSGKKKKKKENTTTEVTTQVPTTEEVDPMALLREQAQYIYNNSDSDYLMIVNDTNPLVDGYTFEQHTLNSGYIVDERIYPDLLEMLNACNDAGYEYTIKGGYVSADTEGSGEYATGLAFDVTAHDVATLDENVASLGTNQWLMQNCSKYGFILRNPSGKENVTGKSFEPWHFRYVGRDAANFITMNHLSLEDFHTLLNGGAVDTSAPFEPILDSTQDPGSNDTDVNDTDVNDVDSVN